MGLISFGHFAGRYSAWVAGAGALSLALLGGESATVGHVRAQHFPPGSTAARGLAVANLGLESPIDVSMLSWDLAGREEQSVIRGIQACSVAPYELPDARPYSGVILSGPPSSRIGAIGRAAYSVAQSLVYVEGMPPAKEFVVPLALKAMQGQMTRAYVLNPSSWAHPHVKLELTALGESQPSHVYEMALTRLWQGDMSFFGALDVPDDFVGWLRIASEHELLAGTIVELPITEGNAAVYGVEALPPSEHRFMLHAPVIRREHPGTTAITVANPGPRQVEVAVCFRGEAGSCEGESCMPTASIPAYANAIFYQGEGSMPLTGESPLPSGCSGSAVITASSGNVAVAVNEVGPGWPPVVASGYRAVGADEASRQLIVPMWHNAGPWPGATTVIKVMETTHRAATVRLRLWDNTGTEIVDCGAPCGPFYLPPGRAHEIDLAAIPAVSPGAYGWARLVGDRPIIAHVYMRPPSDASGSPAGDAGAYTALPCGDEARDEVGLVFPGEWIPCPDETECPRPSPSPTVAPPVANTVTPEATDTRVPDPGPSPSLTSAPVDSPTPLPSPGVWSSPTPSTRPSATHTPSDTPTASSTPTPLKQALACQFIMKRVPAVAIDWALANPERVYGWDELAFPGRPPSPVNIRKRWLSIRNVAMPYDQWFNPLVYKAGCP